MDADALLDDLDRAQREAVATDAAPLGILAGAGSGKTRVLTRRIAHRIATGAADAPHVLAVTFTRRAAAELRTRLWRLGVRDRITAGTFHGVAWAALRQRAADRAEPEPVLLADRARLVARVLEPRSSPGPVRRGPTLAEVVGEIDWAKARGVSPDGYPSAAAEHDRRPPSGLAAVATRFAAYEAARRRARSLDFDDLLAVCTDALWSDRRWGEAQRWRFRHLFVDELQDVSPLQFALLEAWRDGRDDICVVGDPNQAIYGWNGAEPSFLRELPTHLPGATLVRLRTNYRSTPQVLAVAETVLAQPSRRRARPRTTPEAAVPAAADGPVPIVRAYPDEHAEGRAIATLLTELHPDARRWSAMAVLVRTHNQLGPIERALNDAGIPVRVAGRRLGEHPAVRERLGATARDRLGRGGLADLADDLAVALEPAPEHPAIVDGEAPPALELGDRLALEALLALAREELADDPRAPLTTLVAALAGAEGAGVGVDLATFHAAKGLEWDTVVVAGVEDGFVPIAGARGAAGREEEARLLYVALTRARRQLVVTRATARHRGLDLVARGPSPWLAAIEAVCVELARPPDPDLVHALLVDAHERVEPESAREAAAPDPLVALRAWRAHAARAARIPELAVCADDVLAAIATSRPHDVEALGAVPGVGVLMARRHGDAVLAALGATG